VTTIRALAPTDDRSAFRSGDVELDRFFTKYAGQNQFKHHIGTSYVALDDAGRIIGYATVAAAAIEFEALPVATRKKLPAYPLPILRLARLAVARDVQGQGIGAALLKYTLGLALQMASSYGCLGVVVDAYPTAVAFYAQYGFIALEVLEGESAARPQPTAMFLPLHDVTAAVPLRVGAPRE
jgi:GNAT superfamily N-acetyltransferase